MLDAQTGAKRRGSMREAYDANGLREAYLGTSFCLFGKGEKHSLAILKRPWEKVETEADTYERALQGKPHDEKSLIST